MRNIQCGGQGRLPGDTLPTKRHTSRVTLEEDGKMRYEATNSSAIDKWQTNDVDMTSERSTMLNRTITGIQEQVMVEECPYATKLRSESSLIYTSYTRSYFTEV